MSKLVGILNITPDSFSDGAKYDEGEAALRHAELLIADGADVIDVGAESTRPGATPITSKEEVARLNLLPELVKLCHSRQVLISLDTYHSETAAYGLECGVDWINDVNGLRDEGMVFLLQEADCDIVIMHSLGVPADQAFVIADDDDPVAAVKGWCRAQLDSLAIDPARIILDPGIGFGKSAKHSLALLAQASAFEELGCPLLYGHSRKSFMSLFTDAPAAERDDLTLAFSAMLASQKVDYLRVHNVAAHRQLMDAL